MKATIYLAYFMSSFFMVLAAICLLAPSDNSWLPGNRRYVMSAVMAAYSAFRFYRTRKLSRVSQ
jgi:hypothetical protein